MALFNTKLLRYTRRVCLQAAELFVPQGLDGALRLARTVTKQRALDQRSLQRSTCSWRPKMHGS